MYFGLRKSNHEQRIYNLLEIQQELINLNVKIVRPLAVTDYSNREFVFEDVDGRWIAVGNKQN